MKKVITYGTFDLLHYGHINLLKRAKKLGDYLIVGVTSDDYDKSRGKINVKQSTIERIEAIKSLGIADEIIVEEYEGQKIDDIQRYNVDIFTVGSDWTGKFDYLNEYCEVTYLDRTEGISSSEIRTKNRKLQLGLFGDTNVLIKYFNESIFVNGIQVSAVCSKNEAIIECLKTKNIRIYANYDELLDNVDALYIVTNPFLHYEHIKKALLQNKHVLCESPITLKSSQYIELYELAQEKNLILMEANKTAYATAFNRLILLVKSGAIGNVVSVDSTCTSLQVHINQPDKNYDMLWNSICAWGPTAMLPVFKILGTDYISKKITSLLLDDSPSKFDSFTKIDFVYKNAVASIKVGKGIKSEGELIISGTKGYIYVPAPWWKTDYFEIRFENQTENKRYFYQLDGEGIRYELVAFAKYIENKNISKTYISNKISLATCSIMEDFENNTDCTSIHI